MWCAWLLHCLAGRVVRGFKLASFMAVSVAAAAFVVFFALLDAMDFMARGKR